MRVIIAGSRGITDRPLLEKVIKWSGFKISEVVCGCARGVDKMGGHGPDDKSGWAQNNGIDVKHFKVSNEQWKKHPKIAGFMRNQEMAVYTDAAILLWDGKSGGTVDMLERMIDQHKPYYIHTISDAFTGIVDS